MKRTTRTAWFAAALAALLMFFGAGAARAQEEPSLGDPAPALDVLEWAKNGPWDLAAAKGKNVVVIDFFSVNWTISKAHAEGRNKLLAKHAAAGLAILGVATDSADDVKKFCAENELKYPVCVDNMRNSIGSYGTPEPPLVVILDKEGRIAWRGQSLAEHVLEKVLAGKYDVAKAKRTLELERAMQRQFSTDDPDKIEPAADTVLAHEPNSTGAITVRHRCFLKRRQPAEWRAWIAKHVPKMTEAEALNAVAWELATDASLEWREPAAALAAATKAVELSQSKDAAILDTQARVFYELGLVDRAIAVQKASIAAIPAESESMKPTFEKTLAYYEAAAAAAKTIKPDAAPKPAPAKKK